MIYFVLAREVGALKIGFAERPWCRLSKMRTDSPCELQMLAIVEGGISDERALHERFAPDRIRGEWFTFSEALRDHVAGLPPAIGRLCQPSPTSELAAKAGISKSYASEIVNGIRDPSRSLAIHILRMTGWRHGSLLGLSDSDNDTLERIEPFVPREREPA